MEDKLFHADRHDETNSRFSQFANAPKKYYTWSIALYGAETYTLREAD
jgi:hypothetical protein